MKTKRLSVAISIMAGVAVIIAIVYLAYLSHKRFEETMVSQTQRQLLLVAKATAKSLEEFIEEHLNALKILSNDPEIKEQIHNKAQWKKEESEEFCKVGNLYEVHKKDVDALYLIDADGVILDRDPFKEGAIGTSIASAPGVPYVLRERKPYISEIFSTKSHYKTISILDPVFYNEEFVGMVGWLVNVNTIYKNFVQPITAGKRGYAWLLDDGGIMLAHPKAEHVGEDIMAPRKEKFPDYDWSELEDVVEKMTKGEEGVGIYHSAWWTEEKLERVMKLTAYAPVHIGNELWSIGVSMGYSEITGPINEHARNTFGFAGLVILLFGAGGALLFRAEKRKAELNADRRHLQQIAESAKALRESEERYRTLVDNLDLGITLIDTNYKIIIINAAYSRHFNKPASEFVGKNCFREFEKRKEACPHCPGTRAMATGHSAEVEAEGVRDDGSRFPARVRAFPVFGSNGKVMGFIEVAEDITERKRAEEEKNKLEVQLGQAQKVEALGTLAGGIAHNFNNLLTGIQGNASLMLLETDPTHLNYQRLKIIEKAVQSGSGLTRQLLGYAREGRYEIRPISLNQLVKETSDTFGETKKEIRVHRELAEDLFGVKADQGQIEQVLLNLYVNATDAMPGGGDLFLKTMNVTHNDMKGKPYKAKPGNYVLLTVADTGVGMDKKTMERIFDPFFTTKGLAKGTGLGLASVYGIVKAHGGYIDVESEKGHGTTLYVCLPASERKVEEAVKSAEQIIEGSGTILLVDDEEMVLDVSVQLLKALDYTVLEAKGGREAVEVYRENKDKIDMVLLDMIMPDMGGGEAYDLMKEINTDIKVLLSSGYSIDGQATEILDRGCDGFIQKPFNMKELSKGIREILDKG